MIRPKLFLCAEGVTVDRESNNASAFNILDQLNLERLPAVFARMMVLSVLERDKRDPKEWSGTLGITLAGSKILSQPVRYDFQDKKRSRNVFLIGGLPITQPGTMEICLRREDERRMTSYTIDVIAPERQRPRVKKGRV